LRTLSDLAVTDAHLSDRDALEAAVDIVRKHRERWREFLDLVRERGWDEASLVAAIDCQVRAMRVAPWREAEVPCLASPRGRSRASRLLRRMLKRGISRYHPNPLAALEAAGAPVR
jgi:DNA-binding IclR family transcriptional regulator